jgi:hypothetical protein
MGYSLYVIDNKEISSDLTVPLAKLLIESVILLSISFGLSPFMYRIFFSNRALLYSSFAVIFGVCIDIKREQLGSAHVHGSTDVFHISVGRHHACINSFKSVGV